MDINGVVELAALGRPFTLGMLYDLRSDSLVTGMTLWDDDMLSKHITVTHQNFSEFEVITSDSLESKTSAFKMDASLKLSILAGKVNVGGSASYLNESKPSSHHERITLRYKETNLFKEMSMDHFGNLQYEYIIDKGLATHVVTAILYGAQAFFVFDREVSEDENRHAIHGELNTMIKKIPKFSGQARGDVKMDSEDHKKVDQFSCKFLGDVCLDKNPTTFAEAIETYKSLPELFKDEEKAVPMTVYMLPLTAFSSSATKLVRQISAGLVQEVQSLIESFTELDMRCNDVLKTATLEPFSKISEKLKRFKALCAQLKLECQQTLAEKLPLLRGGQAEEAELTEILQKIHFSVYNNKNLNQWIDEKEREIHTLMLFKEKMKNTTFIQSETQLFKEVLRADKVLCFVFTSLGSDEPFLSHFENYLREISQHNKGANILVTKESLHPSQQNSTFDGFLNSKIATPQTIENAKLFSDIAEANKGNQKIKFLAMALTDDNHEGSTIYLFEDGFCVTKNFECPPKPEAVTDEDISHNSVTLKVSPPVFGAENITSYSVEFCVNETDEWKKIESKDGKVTIRNLTPNTEYVFRCRGVTPIGYGPASDPTSPIKTLPCSPPEELKFNPDKKLLTWKKPTEIGPGVQNLKYIVNYTNEKGSHKRETEHEQETLHDVQIDLRYEFKVHCEFEAGKSKDTTITHFAIENCN